MDFPSLNKSNTDSFDCYCDTKLDLSQPERVKSHLETCLAYSFSLSGIKELIEGIGSKQELQVARIYLNLLIDKNLSKFSQEFHKEVQRVKPIPAFNFANKIEVRFRSPGRNGLFER